MKDYPTPENPWTTVEQFEAAPDGTYLDQAGGDWQRNCARWTLEGLPICVNDMVSSGLSITTLLTPHHEHPAIAEAAAAKGAGRRIIATAVGELDQKDTLIMYLHDLLEKITAVEAPLKYGGGCVYCGKYGEYLSDSHNDHADDCAWKLAKEYLAETSQ